MRERARNRRREPHSRQPAKTHGSRTHGEPDNELAGMTSVRRVHVIEGRPWKDAIISAVEPRSPYRPWHAADGIEPGDAVIAVLDTDPRSVLAAVAQVGPEGDIGDAIAAIDRFDLNGLLELGTLQMMAHFGISPVAGPLSQYRSPEDFIATLSGYMRSTSDALFGRTSLAAARVLLRSEGQCTACGLQVDLKGEDARDRVHIHTANPPAPRHAEPERDDT